MMLKDIYDPLSEYVDVFHDRFKEVAENTFSKIAEEASIDIEANRATCHEICQNEKAISCCTSRIDTFMAWSILLWVFVVCSIAVILFAFDIIETWIVIVVCILDVVAVWYFFFKMYPKFRDIKKKRADYEDICKRLKKEAWNQMAPLNGLYDWDLLMRMMSETVPRLEFDPYFTTQRLADLRSTYNWDDSFNEDRSVIYSHSGLINGNPFVFCRTRKMNMESKIYSGSLTIHWTETQVDSEGKSYTVQRSQVLTASMRAPYPVYYEKTRLIYGNIAAPDLVFNRKKSGLAGNEESLSYKYKRHSLRRKSRKLTKSDFAMLSNEEFEVAFNTSDRNNNQQFSLLFTPLAQESMLKLLKDYKVGYGDDFDFHKNKMINTIISDHLQNIDLNINPNTYSNFDYDKAKENFYSINANYFRAIYFALAPLLCVPMYQQIRSHNDIYGHDMKMHSSFWEHEALANFWGQKHFQHPDCITDCILKTDQKDGPNDDSTINVYAYGYKSERRLSYISVYGGDGYYHDVPVYWDEYIPVSGKGQMRIKEDNDESEQVITQKQRINRINKILLRSNLDIYRRHIASKVI